MKVNRYYLLILLTVSVIYSCKHEPPDGPVDPNPVINEICFESQILPIFTSNCASSGCHDAASANKDYILNSYASIMASDDGKGIRPGNTADSKIVEVIKESDPDKRMPLAPQNPLTSEQIALIETWIMQGAKNTTNCGSVCDTTQFTYSGFVAPLISTHCVGCHSGQFPSGGISLNNYGEVAVYAQNGRLFGSINHSPGFSNMPQGATKLPDYDINRVKKWVDAGSPNN